MKTITPTRPKYLNLFKIRFPIPAIVSILHRISGVVLFLSSPFFIWLLSKSLSGEAGFVEVQALLQTGLGKIFSIVIIWAIVHHFVAGIRYFVLDLDVGLDKLPAQRNALLVLVLVTIGGLYFSYKVLT